jgi:hypothetical protein
MGGSNLPFMRRDLGKPAVVVNASPLGFSLGDISRTFTASTHMQLNEGAIWDRRRGEHEAAIRIVKCVHSRVGSRYLVEGLESGRQWLVSAATLLNAYEPCGKPRAVPSHWRR